MILLRRLLGASLRRERQNQERTLRQVSADARVSLGYLSEVERGQKEPSSELLAAICEALGVRLSDVLHDVGDELAILEAAAGPALGTEPQPRHARSASGGERVGSDGGVVSGELQGEIDGAMRDVVVAA